MEHPGGIHPLHLLLEFKMVFLFLENLKKRKYKEKKIRLKINNFIFVTLNSFYLF